MKDHSSFLSKYKSEVNGNISLYELWIKKYGQNFDRIFLENIQVYENGISQFSNKYQQLLDEEIETNLTEAWNFCVFDIVKFKRLEENLHSPLLKEFLDPNGSHGQKDLFYKLFIQTFLSEEEAYCFINVNGKDYLIKSEEFVNNDSDTGRIDIFIKSINPSKKFALIIENKWESGDSCPDQLYKYYRYFTKIQGYTDDNLMVIYLTKNGNDPAWIENIDFEIFLEERKGKNYFPISYISEINHWLKKCYDNCKSEKVKSIIEQYLIYLSWHQ